MGVCGTRRGDEGDVSAPGRSLRMFLVDGTPGGLVTAEIMNWTGHLLAGSRTELRELLARPEAHRTGIYLLIGDAPDSIGGLRVYIGEGDDISTRLASHQREKDFWQRAVLVTSKDANLTKAHARYLESRFLEIARAAQRAEIVNSTSPPLIGLPEADRSDMEYFITQALIALPMLGVDVLRTRRFAELPSEGIEDRAGGASALVDQVAPPTFPTFVLANSRSGWTATAIEADGEFSVLKGSQARLTHNGNGSYVELRSRLERDGTLDMSGEHAVFTRDHVFASPSAAASVVGGASVNGRTSWREAETGATYAEWQDRLLQS
ncbi:DUF4357 domain-containing protein [Clavibacter michiganensis]|nr:DUF4357 domain-containing protein [Clavibacter michiganensis]